MSELATYRGTGKRKTSVARVILRPGDGKTWINGRTLEAYFPRLVHRTAVLAPLKTTALEGQYDLRVRVHGGGGQVEPSGGRSGLRRADGMADAERGAPNRVAERRPARRRTVGRVALIVCRLRPGPVLALCSSNRRVRIVEQIRDLVPRYGRLFQ